MVFPVVNCVTQSPSASAPKRIAHRGALKTLCLLPADVYWRILRLFCQGCIGDFFFTGECCLKEERPCPQHLLLFLGSLVTEGGHFCPDSPSPPISHWNLLLSSPPIRQPYLLLSIGGFPPPPPLFQNTKAALFSPPEGKAAGREKVEKPHFYLPLFLFFPLCRWVKGSVVRFFLALALFLSPKPRQ